MITKVFGWAKEHVLPAIEPGEWEDDPGKNSRRKTQENRINAYTGRAVSAARFLFEVELA